MIPANILGRMHNDHKNITVGALSSSPQSEASDHADRHCRMVQDDLRCAT